MNEAVDTRVVEAKFDSKEFEKGVDRTVKKLDELKSSLNLKDSGKSVTDLTNKISEGTQKASDSLEKLQNRFTSFTGMLKQKFIGGIADEIVGTFFRIKSSFESMVRSMSTAQISVGMSRYTDILTSVRTLVSAGVNQDTAYKAIERLGLYADQTSYSLDSMVATMSKFKTAGADINTAARMIEGLSNAAASMGVNAQQAERAYLNLQQAYSKKVMLQNDWISFESLPMVGTKFNQAIIDAAVKVGTLEADKKDKDGKVLSYKTKKKKGTKVSSARGITADNLGSNLASRWFTDEVMEEVFGNTYYFEDIGIERVNEIKAKEQSIRNEVKKLIDAGELDASKLDEESDKRLQEYFDAQNKEKLERKKHEIEIEKQSKKADLEAKKISKQEYDKLIKELDDSYKKFEKENSLTVFQYQAFRAGQEARSFTDVLNTLKDAISRGWATSFELIFGKLDEAADFFTKLTESDFADAIYKIGEFRNAILTSWRDNGGRDNMISTLGTIDDLFGSIFKKMGLIRKEDLFDELFDEEYYNTLLEKVGESEAEAYKKAIENEASQNSFEAVAEGLGQRLALLTRNIGYYIEQVRDWFTEIDPKKGTSRLDRITKLFNDIGAIVHEILTLGATGFGKFLGILGQFLPVLSSIFENVSKLLEPISRLFSPDENGDPSKLYTAIENVFGNISKVVTMLVGENGDGPLIKVLNVLGDIAAFFIDMAASTFMTNVQFFSDAFGLLMEVIFGTSTQKDRDNSGVIGGIANDITALGDACKTAIQFVADFFSTLIDNVRKWLGISEETGAIQSIGSFFESWFYDSFDQKEYEKLLEQDKTGYAAKQYKDHYKEKQLKPWLDAIVTAVREFFTELPGNISKAIGNIGSFFGQIFDTLFYDKKNYKYIGPNNVTKVVQVKMLKPWVKAIANVFKNLPLHIHNALKDIGNIATMIWNSLLGKGKGFDQNTYDSILKEGGKEAAERYKKSIEDGFKGLSLQSILDTLQTIGLKIWNDILTIFTGNQDVEFNNNWLAEKVAGAIDWIGARANEAWNGISDFIISLPTKIADIFRAEENPDSGTVESSIKSFGENIGIWLSSIPSTLLATWKNVEKELNNLGTTVYEAIMGIFNSDKSKRAIDVSKLSEAEKRAYEELTRLSKSNPQMEKALGSFTENIWKRQNPIIANLSGFFEEAKEYIINTVRNFPTDIATGLSQGASLLNELFTNITGWFSNENAKAQEAAGKEITENASENFAKGTEDAAGEQSPFLKAISDFGSTIATFITQTIPGFISQGFTWVKNNAQEWTSSLNNLLFGGATNAEGEVLSFGDNIVKAFESLPGKFRVAINTVTKLFRANDFSQEIYDQLLNDDPTGYGAEMYKRAHPGNPVIVFFENLVKTAGEILQDIGPTILNGLNTGLNWVGSKLTSATEFLNQAVGQGKNLTEIVEESLIDEETGKENPLWTAIKNIGQTLKTIIIEVIPQFLSAGVQYVAQQVPRIFSGLFGGGETKKTVEEAKENITKNVDEIKKFSQEEFDRLMSIDPTGYAAHQYKNSFKNDEYIDYAEAMAEQYGVSVESVREAMISSLGGNLGEFGFLLSSAQADSLSEEELLKLQKNSFDQYASDLSVTEISAGKAVKKAEAVALYQKRLALINSEQAKLAEEGNKDNEIKALEEQKIHVNSIISALEGISEEEVNLADIDKNAKNPNESKNIFDKIIGFATNLIQTVSTFVNDNSQMLKTVLIFGAIVYVLHTITELIDQVQALDDIGYAAKWIGLSTAITGLTTLLGYLTILASQEDEFEEDGKTLTRYGRVKKFLSDFIKDVKDILGMIEVIVGLNMAGKLFEMIQSFNEKDGEIENNLNLEGIEFDDKQKGELVDALKKKGSFGGLFASGVSNILGSALGKVAGAGTTYLTGTMIGELIENLAGNANDALGQLGSGLEVLSGNVADTIANLKKVKDDVSTAIETVGLVRDLINEMMRLLTFDEMIEDMVEAPLAQENGKYLTSENGKYYKWLDVWSNRLVDISSDSVQIDEETGQAYFVTKRLTSTTSKLEEIIRIFTELSGALALFKQAISGYGDDAASVSGAITQLLGSREMMEQFAEFAQSDQWKVFTEALTSLGAVFHLYSYSINDNFSEKPKSINISNMIYFLKQLFENEEFKGFIASLGEKSFPDIDQSVVDNASRIVIFASSIAAIADACSQLTGNEASNINALFDVVEAFAPGKTDEEITSIATKFGRLGNALGSFAANTAGLTEANIQNSERALSMLLRISVGLGSLPDNSWFAHITSGDKDIDTFSEKISEAGSNLRDFFNAIDAIDTGTGISKTHNIKNMGMALEALETFARVAEKLSTAGSLSNFSSFITGVLTKSNLQTFAENIGAFIDGIIIKDGDSYKYSEEDFTYFDSMFSIVKRLTEIVAYMDGLTFDNLGTTLADNPLVEYVSKIFNGMNQLGYSLDGHYNGISYLTKYQQELDSYISFIKNVFSALTAAKTLFKNESGKYYDLNTVRELMDNIIDGLFGWTTYDPMGGMTEGVATFHEGALNKLFAFLDQADKYETMLSDHSNAVSLFTGISDMIISFMEAVTQMAKADEVSMMFGQIHNDFGTYVSQLSGALQAILDNRPVFEEFFAWGDQFDTKHVANIALMTSALNQIVQMVATLQETGSITDTTLSSLQYGNHWSRLFEIIQEDIIGDNQDFFSPQITPVLNIDDTFRAKVTELHNLLGVTTDDNTGQMKLNIDMGNISGIEIPQPINYSEELKKIYEQVSSLQTTAEQFSTDISNMQFIINGEELSAVIYPSIDKDIGRVIITSDRGNYIS